MRYKHWVLATLSAFALAGAGWANAQAPFTRMVVFGTSLSDPGNAFALTSRQSVAPDYGMRPQDLLIPAFPYAIGGHHFSNGATWVEGLASGLGLAANALPAFRGASDVSSNYAIGGARANDDGGQTHLTAQVTAFLRDTGPSAPSDALYVIEIGGNDIRDALASALFQIPPGPDAIIAGALGSIAANVGRLHAAGARKFLVWNVPNLALTPAIQALGPIAVAGATQATLGFNGGLSMVLLGLEFGPDRLADIHIVSFDAFDKLNDIVGGLGGLANVKDACITPNVSPFRCQNPDAYLFWDGIHPTAAAHAIIAREVAAALAD
jgi:phospholipase/lecithinase/hemolysin